MIERINFRPEVTSTLQEFSQLVQIFEAVKDDPKLSGIIATAIFGILSKIDLEKEELILVLPKKLSTQNQQQRSRETISQIPYERNSEERITFGATGFYLCSASEIRLLRSIEDTGVILINGFLLAKMVGKISVLALETKEGFQAGHWYAPRTQQMRDKIRSAFDLRHNRLELNSDLWDYMREANATNLPASSKQLNNPTLLTIIDSNEALLEYCKKIISQFTDRMPETIKGMTRKEYRIRYKEGL